MTFACLAPSIASELYRDLAGRERRLRYRKVRGQHVVVADVTGTPFPAVHAFRTVEEARKCWREQRRALVCCGFERYRPLHVGN